MALSNLTDSDSRRTVNEVLVFLLDLLRANDNSGNAYTDNYLVASAIRAVANVTAEEEQMRALVGQVERYLSLDKMIPSYHNLISSACLRTLCDLQMARKIPVNLEVFRKFVRVGNFEEVRIAAWEGLIELATAAINQIAGASSSAGLSLSSSSILSASDSPGSGPGGQMFANAEEAAESLVAQVLATLAEPHESPRLKYRLMKAWYRCFTATAAPAEAYTIPIGTPAVQTPAIAVSLGGKLSPAVLNAEPIRTLREGLWLILKSV